MDALQIEVDGSFCEGTGYCVKICGEVFALDAARQKVLVQKALVTDASLIEKVTEAETTCPTRAIILKRKK